MGHRLGSMTAALVAIAALAGCGGDEPKSEEDRVADVAKQYVAANANSEDAKCLETLAAGVDRKLCGDLAPLATRVNPEVRKKARISGTTAKITVTGAGPVLLDIDLRREGDDWKVVKWRGYAPK